MKKFKLVVPSFIAIIFCMLLIAGSTFALFTSEASASISVTSGKVKISAELTDLKAYSAEAVDTIAATDETAGIITTGNYAGNYRYKPLNADNTTNTKYTFTTSGTVELNTADQSLEIERMVAGDRVKLTLKLTNESNVNVKYRVRLNATSDNGLLENLTLNLGNVTDDSVEKLVGVIKVGAWHTWQAPANEAEKTKTISVELFLPLTNESMNSKNTEDTNGFNSSLHFTIEMVQGNAKTDDILDLVNANISGHKTMYDAYQAALTIDGVTAENFPISNYLWNVDTDQFYTPSTIVAGFENRFFKAYPAMPTTQTYNIYAVGNWSSQDLSHLTVGFDAGEATGITNITYDRENETKGQEVTIRTNSLGTDLTINAPLDTVHHYGDANTVNVIAVAGNSFHVNGNVNLIAVKQGHIKLESTSDVLGIYVYNESTATQKDTSFEPIKITVETTTVPTLSRSAVEIAEEGTKVCTIVTEEAKDVYLFNEGIFEQIKTVDEGKSLTDESVSWADDNSKNTEKTQTAAQQLANEFNGSYDTNGKIADKNVTVDNTEYTVKFDETTRTFETYKDETKVETEEVIAAVAEKVATESGITASEAQSANLFRGEGTENNPYLIASCYAFIMVDANEPINGKLYYKVVEDLDFAEYMKDSTSWCAGALYNDPTMYSIDLNGYTLTVGNSYVLGYASNLELYNGKINFQGNGRAALIGYACEQSVSKVELNFHDLVLSGNVETGAAHYGSLVCYAYGMNSGNKSINASNIVNNMRIVNNNSIGYTGGLFGYVQGSSVTSSVTNCTFNGSIVSAYSGAFLNPCSYPNGAAVTSNGNTLNGQLFGSQTALAFGCNGNLTGGKSALNALQASVTVGQNASLTIVSASTDLISVDDNNEVILSRKDDVETYRVAIQFMVDYLANNTGGYPRYITVDLEQFTADTKATGIYKIAIVQENEDLSEDEQIVLNGNGCKIWLANGTYHVYAPDYELSNNKATIWAYAYNNGNIVAYQQIPYTYQVQQEQLIEK